MLSPNEFEFLAVTRQLNSEIDWNNPAWPKLWLYNAHYFDDLAADESASRQSWHAALIDRWISQNPPGSGNGWEPYPSSLRIVNWIKWSLLGNQLSQDAVHSLAIQCRYLASNLEFHLLGNHLWANAKALCFAGIYFRDKEAKSWLSTGVRIISEQLGEQVLTDGGHFERSPMYHSILLEDVLDLLQLNKLDGSKDLPKELIMLLSRKSQAMLTWLDSMSHPDDEIALFNDSTFGIAPNPAALRRYAGVAGVEAPPRSSESLEFLKPTGYVICRSNDWYLIADIGEIGPDYLPGHAHADTLSFELSLSNARLFVDSGISTYEIGSARHTERGTAAHNTITIAGENSSQVWGGFRVAKRAKPLAQSVEERGGIQTIEAAHDGYRRLPTRNIHRRRWVIDEHSIRIDDYVEGKQVSAEANWLVGPDFAVQVENRGILLTRQQTSEKALIIFSSTSVSVEDAEYHPGFGRTVATKRIRVKLDSNQLHTTISKA